MTRERRQTQPTVRKTPTDGLSGSRCPYDGGPLDAHGFCWIGNGYPYGPPCPFVCPLCRSKLDWDGGCSACFGTGETAMGKRLRSDWTFPGYRHGFLKHHWVQDQGPEKAMSRERVRALTNALEAMGSVVA